MLSAQEKIAIEVGVSRQGRNFFFLGLGIRLLLIPNPDHIPPLIGVPHTNVLFKPQILVTNLVLKILQKPIVTVEGAESRFELSTVLVIPAFFG